MTDYVTNANQAAEQYLTALAKAQDDFIATLTAFVQQAPKAPEGFALPKFDLPTTDLPTAGQITDVSFDFASKLLHQQRTYTDNLIAAVTPAETVAA